MVWNDICAIKVHSKIIFCWSVVFSDEVYSEKKSEKVLEKDNLINNVSFCVMLKFSFLNKDWELYVKPFRSSNEKIPL